MRRLFPFVALALAACASTPPPRATPDPVRVTPTPVRSGLTGLDAAALQGRFGAPSFQVREGPGLKLQWQNATCVLDAYLYPPASGTGAATVTHADTRRPGSGESVPVEGCVAALTGQPTPSSRP